MQTIYVEVPHTNDDDADYLRFDSLRDATEYLQMVVLDGNGEGEFIMSTSPVNLPESEYSRP